MRPSEEGEAGAEVASGGEVVGEHVREQAVARLGVSVEMRCGQEVYPFTEPWSSAVMNWRWKMRKTISVGREDEQRAGAQQRDVGAPLALEGAERAGHGALGGVSTSTMARRNWFQVQRNSRIASDEIAGARERHVDAPEQLPGAGAVDLGRPRTSSSGMFTKWARIQKTANGMNSPISGRMIANLVLSRPRSLDLVVERDDDALERQGQAEHEEQEDEAGRRGIAQVAEAEAGHRGDEHRDRARRRATMSDAREQQRAHVRRLEGLDEVAPLRVGRPLQAGGIGAGGLQRGREHG